MCVCGHTYTYVHTTNVMWTSTCSRSISTYFPNFTLWNISMIHLFNCTHTCTFICKKVNNYIKITKCILAAKYCYRFECKFGTTIRPHAHIKSTRSISSLLSLQLLSFFLQNSNYIDIHQKWESQMGAAVAFQSCYSCIFREGN